MIYGTQQGFQDWLSAQGLELPEESPEPTVLLRIGTSYIDSAYEHALACSSRTGGFTQELAWPRANHRVNGQLVPDDLIPQQWINASYRAAYLQATNPGWATNTSNPDRVVKRQKADVLEREFFAAGQNGGKSDVAPGMPADSTINGLVKALLCSGNIRSPDSLLRVI